MVARPQRSDFLRDGTRVYRAAAGRIPTSSRTGLLGYPPATPLLSAGRAPRRYAGYGESPTLMSSPLVKYHAMLGVTGMRDTHRRSISPACVAALPATACRHARRYGLCLLPA